VADPPGSARERLEGNERALMIALAKLAARYHVVCGGTDVDATLAALRARIDAARADGDTALAEALERGIAAAG
jgi:hypothetical protein